jgi:hypothetical protein
MTDDAGILALTQRIMDILKAMAPFPHMMDCIEVGWSQARGAYAERLPHNGHTRSAHQVLADHERTIQDVASTFPLLEELGPLLAGHPALGPFVCSAPDATVALRVFDLRQPTSIDTKGFQLRLGRFHAAQGAPCRHEDGFVLDTLAQALSTPPNTPEHVTASETTTGSIVGEGAVPTSVLESLWPLFVRRHLKDTDAELYGYKMALWITLDEPHGVPTAGAVLIHNGSDGDFSMRRWVDPEALIGTGQHHGMVAAFVGGICNTLVANARTWVPHPDTPPGRIRQPEF